MGSASRGDGGAEELMRTLGLASKAADSFQNYANSKFQKDEEANAAQGAIDYQAGRVDPQLEAKSSAYQRAIVLGREQLSFPAAVAEYQRQLAEIVEQQTGSDLTERRSEVDQDIERFFHSYARDPDTGEIRESLATPEAKRWLATAIESSRARLTVTAHARIDERFRGEGLTNVGGVFHAQLLEGTVNIAALRELLPPNVTDDEFRSTLVTTLAGAAEQLKTDKRYKESLGLIYAALGDGAAPAPTAALGEPPATPARATAPSTAKRRSRSEVLTFILNDLEGGAKTVDNADGAGTTRFGITKRNNPDVDVANLTFGQAKSIAESRYWQPIYNDAHPAVAAIAFDAGFINSKSFAREIATKYRNDPAGALNAYRKRLQDIAKKPEKARFMRGWMNRVDRLGTYLGVGPGGVGSDNVVDDPSFVLDPAPLDPVEEARLNPGISFASQLVGGLALRPEERTKLIGLRDQLSREVKDAWTREARERQDDNANGYLLRLSGLGAPLAPTEIAEASRRREISPAQTRQLLEIIRSDADRDAAQAERATIEAERDRERADESTAQGIVASLMGPVYSGTRTPSEALKLFNDQAARLPPRVRRAVLGAVTAEANGVEEVRKNNPALRTATDRFDDYEQEALRRVRGPYRDPSTGRLVTAEVQRAIISAEFAKAKRTLFQTAIDKGDVSKMPAQLEQQIAVRIRRYLAPQSPQPAR